MLYCAIEAKMSMSFSEPNLLLAFTVLFLRIFCEGGNGLAQSEVQSGNTIAGAATFGLRTLLLGTISSGNNPVQDYSTSTWMLRSIGPDHKV